MTMSCHLVILQCAHTSVGFRAFVTFKFLSFLLVYYSLMFKPSCLVNASFIAKTTSALVSHVQSCFFLLVLFQTQDIVFVTERSRLITAVPADTDAPEGLPNIEHSLLVCQHTCNQSGTCGYSR